VAECKLDDIHLQIFMHADECDVTSGTIRK
jgi:hypothetical protein